MRSVVRPVRASAGEEDHALAGPDDEGLEEQEQRAGNADVDQAVEGEGDPMLDLGDFGIVAVAGEGAVEGGLERAGAEDERQQANGGDGEEGLGEGLRSGRWRASPW